MATGRRVTLVRRPPSVCVFLVAAALTLSACGSFTSTELEPRAAGGTPPYAGALDEPVRELDSNDPMERSGAAGKALECDGEVAQGAAYEEGLIERGASAAEALRIFIERSFWALPHSSYRIEVEKDQHTLLSYDLDGRTRAAVVIAKSDDAQHADLPWAMSTFATCDQAEFPPSVDEDFGRRIWVDRAGNRMPSSVIISHFGAAHCDWESVTFLSLKKQQFIADPEGILKDADIGLRTSYDQDTVLPADAQDSGYRLDGAQLWKAADGASVFVVTADGVERWPGVREPLGCK